ncbi:hypothetical protein [Azospirillum thiophilum]|uniref:hypothetical protein n=1 Tax=Azospirillum thiophilum TaxID=528244 RepID=UPI0005F029A3|nr:hypothetical protein [Azospirillum thiophilum]
MIENEKEAGMASNTSPKEAAGNPHPVGTIDNACATCVYDGQWTPDDITIKIHDDLTDDPIVTAEIGTPDGTLWVMAEVSIDNETRVMTLKGLNTHGHDVGSQEYGTHRLIRLAKVVMEVMDVDQTNIEGAIRRSGANPGRLPRPFRIKRSPPSQRPAGSKAEHAEGGGDPGAAAPGDEEGAHRPDPTAG